MTFMLFGQADSRFALKKGTLSTAPISSGHACLRYAIFSSTRLDFLSLKIAQ